MADYDLESLPILSNDYDLESLPIIKDGPSWTDTAVGSVGLVLPGIARTVGRGMEFAGLPNVLPEGADALESKIRDYWGLNQIEKGSAQDYGSHVTSAVADIIPRAAMGPLGLLSIFGLESGLNQYTDTKNQLEAQGLPPEAVDQKANQAMLPSMAVGAGMGAIPALKVLGPAKAEGQGAIMGLLEKMAFGSAELPALGVLQSSVDNMAKQAVGAPGLSREDLASQLVDSVKYGIPTGAAFGGMGGVSQARKMAERTAADKVFRQSVAEAEAALMNEAPKPPLGLPAPPLGLPAPKPGDIIYGQERVSPTIQAGMEREVRNPLALPSPQMQLPAPVRLGLPAPRPGEIIYGQEPTSSPIQAGLDRLPTAFEAANMRAEVPQARPLTEDMIVQGRPRKPVKLGEDALALDISPKRRKDPRIKVEGFRPRSPEEQLAAEQFQREVADQIQQARINESGIVTDLNPAQPSQLLKLKKPLGQGPRETTVLDSPWALGEKGAIDIWPAVDKAKEIAGRLWDRDYGLEKAPPEQRYLEGKDGIPVPRPLDLLARPVKKLGRNLVATNSRMAEKFPEARPTYQEQRNKNRYVTGQKTQFNEELAPYSRLGVESRDKVNAYLIALNNVSQVAKAKGQEVPQLTPEKMERAGFTKEEQAAASTFRSFLDNTALAKLQEALLADVNKIPENHVEARRQYIEDVVGYVDGMRGTNYFPRSRFGQEYEVRATQKNGKAFVNFYDNPGEARAEVARLKKEGATIERAGERILIPQGAMSDLPPDLAQSLSNFQHFDPGKYTSLATKDKPMKGFGKHLISAQGVEGFQKDLLGPIGDYAEGLANFSGRKLFDPKIEGAIDAITNPTLRERMRKNYQNSQREQGGMERGILQYASLWTLAGVPAAGIQNAFQVINTMTDAVGKKGANSFTKGGKALAQAAIEAPQYLFGIDKVKTRLVDRMNESEFFGEHPELKGVLERTILKPMDPKLREVLDRFYAEGELGMKNNVNYPRKPGGVARRFTPSELLMITFSGPEIALRTHATITGYKIAREKGYAPTEAEQFANEFSNKTQFDMTKSDIMPARSNPITNIAFQYKDYMVKQLRFMKDRLTPDDWRAAVTLTALTGTFGGAMYGVPGVRDLIYALESLGIDAISKVREFLGGTEKQQDAIMFGAPTLLGVRLGGYGVGQAIPEIDKDPLTTVGRLMTGPAGQILTRGAKSYTMLQEKRPDYLGAAINMAPRGVRGPANALRAALTGEIKNARGEVLVDNPTGPELGWTSLSLTPNRLARSYETNNSIYIAGRQGEGEAAKYHRAIAQAQMNKDRETVRELRKEAREDKVRINESAIRQQMLKLRNPRAYQLKQVPKQNRPAVRRIIENDKAVDD